VKRGYERRALAAGGNVAAAEIGDHAHAGQLGEQRRIADLRRIAPLRAVTHRLAVAAGGANRGGGRA